MGPGDKTSVLQKEFNCFKISLDYEKALTMCKSHLFSNFNRFPIIIHCFDKVYNKIVPLIKHWTLKELDSVGSKSGQEKRFYYYYLIQFA